jgi:hypothetical protein
VARRKNYLPLPGIERRLEDNIKMDHKLGMCGLGSVDIHGEVKRRLNSLPGAVSLIRHILQGFATARPRGHALLLTLPSMNGL